MKFRPIPFSCYEEKGLILEKVLSELISKLASMEGALTFC